MSTLPGLFTCLLLVTHYFIISESARKKLSPKCQAAWQECSLLTTDAIENFLQNKICENVKKSIECYSRHGCPEGEPHLKSLHNACGMIKEPMIKAERVPPGSKVSEKTKQVQDRRKKISTDNKKQPEKGKKSPEKTKKLQTKTKKSSTKAKTEL